LLGRLLRGRRDTRGPRSARTDPVGRGPSRDPDDVGELDGGLVRGSSGGSDGVGGGGDDGVGGASGGITVDRRGGGF
jgi:hypothetical protein